MNIRLPLSASSLRPRRFILLGVIVIVVAMTITNNPRFIVDAAPGDLDPTFGQGGKVVTTTHGLIYDMAIQQDGKIVAAGPGLSGIALIRYNTCACR